MIKSIGEYGQGLKPPSYHEVRVTYLKKEVENVNDMLEKYKNEWEKKIGCTLMSDGWTNGRGRSITNFLVNSPSGTVFLKSIDTSNISHSGENMFELLDSMVEEIGEDHVVQVVTDSASAYVLAEDIGQLPVHANTLSKAKQITTFIYRHTLLINMIRKFANGYDLIRAGSDGKKVENLVVGDAKFWDAIVYCLKSVIPLVKVLRLVDGDAKPAMGYIFEAMDRAKEKIAKNFDDVSSRLHFDPIFNHQDEEVTVGLIQTIERMYPDMFQQG
ncbi:uncharacterized protein LOC120284165 [Dioscorea cayenensis subsp. rotundata]|uniref:Uncharacterized protein LOC120284165 n=1 Tax=Dioscorea cayennensis subsp. rotundata TaxID=55577 RepID=A0AB40D3B2_DIOCR|nr:uncharacterized protein LOC120284165 [Dioscorea cayenensis subsp. rotundata]